MKVLFHFNASPELLAWLKTQVPRDWHVVCCPESDADAFAHYWPGTHVLWHVLQPVTAARIHANPALRLVQKIGVGVNTIDLPAAAQQGVAVCNMPGVNSRAVAEMSLGLMLMAARRMGQIAGRDRARVAARPQPSPGHDDGQRRGRAATVARRREAPAGRGACGPHPASSGVTSSTDSRAGNHREKTRL